MKYATPYRKHSTAGAHFGGRAIPSGTGRKFGLNRALLPSPVTYLQSQQIPFKGAGQWLDVLCPFHDDTSPSLRMHSERGSFKCMACGEKGGDLIAFHMKRTGLGFVEACKAIGAWEQHA